MDKISVQCGFCDAKYERYKVEFPFLCSACHCTIELPEKEGDSIDTFIQSLGNNHDATQEKIEVTQGKIGATRFSQDAKTIIQKTSKIAKISRYETIKVLGSGGMGKVLLVKDINLDREVAMKILKKDIHLQSFGQRFITEAKITGKLEHPNIIPVYDMDFQEDGSCFFTMKCVRGEKLSDIITNLKNKKEILGQLSVVHRLEIFLKICEALSYAHSKGVLHLDLKPDNIMVGEFGEVFVMDWGIARTKAISVEKDHAREVIGTIAYMSQEQADGDLSKIDERADVYGLGAILYELITLHPMFTDENPLNLLLKVKEEEPQNPSRDIHGIKVPDSLRHIILKSISKRKTNRYQNVNSLARDIRNFLDDKPLIAKKDTLLDKIKRQIRSNLNLSFGIVAVVLSISFLIFGILVMETSRQGEKRKIAKQFLAEASIAFEKGKELYEQKKTEKAETKRIEIQCLEDESWNYAISCFKNAMLLDSTLAISSEYEEIYFLRYEYNKKLPITQRRESLPLLKKKIQEITDRYDSKLSEEK